MVGELCLVDKVNHYNYCQVKILSIKVLVQLVVLWFISMRFCACNEELFWSQIPFHHMDQSFVED